MYGQYISVPQEEQKKAAFYLAESLGKEVKEVDLSAPDFNGAEFKRMIW